jgi:hypothetical protein
MVTACVLEMRKKKEKKKIIQDFCIEEKGGTVEKGKALGY